MPVEQELQPEAEVEFQQPNWDDTKPAGEGTQDWATEGQAQDWATEAPAASGW